MPKSGKHGNKGQLTLIRNYDDKDVVKTMDVTLTDCKKDELSGYNSTKSICANRGTTWETNDVSTFINFKKKKKKITTNQLTSCIIFGWQQSHLVYFHDLQSKFINTNNKY